MVQTNASAIHADVVSTATPLSLTSDLSDIPYIEDADVNNGYRSATSITPQLSQSKSVGSVTKKSGFPLTKLKSQFKPAQLTLTAVPIDAGTKDDKGITDSKQLGLNLSEPTPHSVPGGHFDENCVFRIFRCFFLCFLFLLFW